MSNKRRYAFFPQPFLSEAEPVWRPAADIYRTRDGWILKFDLAGVDQRDVAVHVQGCRVTVRGIRRDTLRQEDCSYYCMEINYSAFERTIELPCQLESARWEFEFNNGMLLVQLSTGGEQRP
jgi:HSP20 family protein